MLSSLAKVAIRRSCSSSSSEKTGMSLRLSGSMVGPLDTTPRALTTPSALHTQMARRARRALADLDRAPHAAHPLAGAAALGGRLQPQGHGTRARRPRAPAGHHHGLRPRGEATG